jgi:hypothetical protein
MSVIVRKNLDEPDGTSEFEHGRSAGVQVGDSELWRSELEPGWSWDVDVKPWAGDWTSCQLTHFEYVLEGRIRYLMEDGTEVTAGPGDHLYIGPGHRAWVVGDERCVTLDW